MTNEIDIFKNKEIASFGGKTLQANLTEAENAIAELSDDFRIHNHSNTQFAWKHFVLNHKSGLRNARQITAEISRKKLALSEAKHRHTRKVIKIEILQESLGNNQEIEDTRLVKADIEKLTDEIKISLEPIEGAIKDILILKNAYDQIMETHTGYTEADLEEEEISYWIHRLFSQALRDMRQSGIIMSGNQEAIEQMGLNLSKVRHDLVRYLKKEEEDKSLDNKLLQGFLKQSVDKYTDAIKAFIGVGGFNGSIIEAAIFMPNK